MKKMLANNTFFRMKNIFVPLVLLLAVLGSCTKQNADRTEEKMYTINASFDKTSDTRTTLGEGNVPVWEIGDRIWLSDGIAATYGTVKSVSEETGFATIETSLDISGKTVYAVYPYISDESSYINADGSIVFEIPGVQTGTFREANICVSVGNQMDGLRFRNACALMKLEEKTDDVQLLKFEKEAISGKFAINSNLEVSPVETSSAVSAIVESSIRGPFFVAVAPGIHYAKGETIASYCKKNGQCLKKRPASKGMLVQRSRIYNLGSTISYIDGTIE